MAPLVQLTFQVGQGTIEDRVLLQEKGQIMAVYTRIQGWMLVVRGDVWKEVK